MGTQSYNTFDSVVPCKNFEILALSSPQIGIMMKMIDRVSKKILLMTKQIHMKMELSDNGSDSSKYSISFVFQCK